MIHRIMIVAALFAVPAIVVAEHPALATTAHAQQADTSKGKAPVTQSMKGKKKKKGKAAKKPAVKPAAPAAKDTGSAKK
jgi:hypothetical protein